MSTGPVVYRCADDSEFDLVVGGEVDAVGNPVGPLPEGTVPVWSVSDQSVVNVTPGSDPKIATVVPTGKLGPAQVSVVANNLTSMFNMEVVPGVAAGLALTPTNVRPKA